jgi:uncharacterized membrane protein YsdA (DUF1294 family)
MLKTVSLYLLLLQAAAFALFALDKLKARWKQRRVPEKALLLVTLLGGSLGALGGMYLFRHKTRRARFYLGVPLCLLLHLALLVFFCGWYIGASP